jgi:hypothetical protein
MGWKGGSSRDAGNMSIVDDTADRKFFFSSERGKRATFIDIPHDVCGRSQCIVALNCMENRTS